MRPGAEEGCVAVGARAPGGEGGGGGEGGHASAAVHTRGARGGDAPSTLCACCSPSFIIVERPRSPILISALLPLMKMFSHFRSRWMIRDLCRKASPSSNCRHHFLITLRFTRFALLMYLSGQQSVSEAPSASGASSSGASALLQRSG